MSLKHIVHEQLLNEVFLPLKSDESSTAKEDSKKVKVKGQWKVLVLDEMSKRILSICCNMTEIAALGVTLVEDLHKRREPLPTLEAIYLIAPTEKSIRTLISDFKDSTAPLYKAVHVFFTEACPDKLFTEMSSAPLRKFIKTLKEINVSFLAYEQKVFTLDCPEMFQYYFTPGHSKVDDYMERCAEQLATVCSTLGELPKIRYSTGNKLNEKLAMMVKEKLVEYKANEPKMGQGAQKDRSQLIILDRGFDPISPLVHELTLQAMAYDLLPIENDVYKYTTSTGEVKEVVLEEADEYWQELRHQHVAIVSQKLAVKLKEFASDKRLPDNSSVRDLSQMIKMVPQYQKDLRRFNTHCNLAEECMKSYQTYLNKFWHFEQDLAVGTTEDGDRISQQTLNSTTGTIMLNETISTTDKIRILLLHIIFSHGISGENLSKFVQRGRIPQDEQLIIHNMYYLGVPIVQDVSQNNNKDPRDYVVANRHRERVAEQSLQTSRWTPYVKDIIEEITEDKLDAKKYPFIASNGDHNIVSSGLSARSGGRREPSGGAYKGGPRLIVFIVGGMTMSEMRCVYEVAARNWEILIGSTHILTPLSLLQQLKELGTQ